MRHTIAYYFSFVSPWSYLGHPEFMRIAKAHDVAVVYKPFDVGRVFPETGGLPLSKRHPARQAYRLVEIQRWRLKRQVPMRVHPKFWPFDASLANRVVIALAMMDLNVESFAPHAYAGVFESELELASEATLTALLDAAGVAAQDVLTLAKSDAVQSEYEANLADAIAIGAFGAPVYVWDGELFWGQDRLDLLEDALTSGRKAFSAEV